MFPSYRTKELWNCGNKSLIGRRDFFKPKFGGLMKELKMTNTVRNYYGIVLEIKKTSNSVLLFIDQEENIISYEAI